MAHSSAVTRFGSVALLGLVVLAFWSFGSDEQATTDGGQRRITFNSRQLDLQTIGALEQQFGGMRIPDGDYWYDPRCGAVGQVGGPSMAFLPPGLQQYFGNVSTNASGSATQVMVNGRIIHPQDPAGLQYYLGPIQPGRYFLDAQANYGYEGGQVLGNLLQVAAAKIQGGGGGGSVYRNFPGLNGGTSVSVGGGIVSTGKHVWWPDK